MKRYIPLISILVITVVITLLFDVRVIYQGEEEGSVATGSAKAPRTELDEKTKEQIVREYQREAELRHKNATRQTSLYNEIEFLSLITPDSSLFFRVSRVNEEKNWSEPGSLNGQTVNMQYKSYTYLYEYRAFNKSTNEETTGSGRFVLSNEGASRAMLSISGVSIKVSFRSSRSIYVEHPLGWVGTVLDVNEYDELPLSIKVKSSNKALKPTYFRGTCYVQNRTKQAPLQWSV